MEKLKVKIYNLLRWSEKYIKTDMVYLVKGGSWLTAGDVFSSATIFLLAIAFANLLPKETYGTYKYILSLAGLFSLATLQGITVAVTQAVARGYEGVLVPTIKTRIRWGFLAALASIGAAGYYYLNHDNTLVLSFLLIAAFLPFMDSFMTYDSFLQGKKLFKTSSIYGTASQIIAAILMILTMFLTKNLFIILLVYFTSWTLTRFICLQFTLKRFRPNKEYDSETISYGKHLSMISIIGNIIDSLDNIIIFHFLGAVQVAVYSFALLPVIHFQGLTKKIDILAIPKFAQRPLQEIRLLFWKRMKFLFVLGSVISLIYIITVPFLFRIFFPKYIDSIFFSQVFSVSIALMLGQAILRSAINSRLTLIPKKLLYLLNAATFVLLISMLLLIRPLGIMGIILAKIFSFISAIGIELIIWKKINKSKDHQITASNQFSKTS
jgi:O-antigen/teichoic acid export membrane protein